MVYSNMVENKKFTEGRREVRNTNESGQLNPENFRTLVGRLELHPDFKSLQQDRDKIEWMLYRANTAIQEWHFRTGRRYDNYISWRTSLITRFFYVEREMALYYRKQQPDEKTSEYAAAIYKQSFVMSASPHSCLHQIRKGTNEVDKRILRALERASAVSERLLNTIEDLEMDHQAQQNAIRPLKEHVNKLDVEVQASSMATKIVKVDGHWISALLDSGSGLNLIHTDFVKNMKKSTITHARTANGSKMLIEGETNLPIQIDGLSTRCTFVVSSELTGQCIIGLPFLRDNMISLHFSNAIEPLVSIVPSGQDNKAFHKLLLDKLCEDAYKPVTMTECPIETKEGSRTTARPQIIPQAIESRVLEQLEILKNKGFISKSSSSWCNKLRPVEKEGGSIRIAMNMIPLNHVVKPDNYSLPRMDHIIHGLHGMKLFTKIDLKDGFYHIPVREADRFKTAFRVKNALYEWNVMPQGFINAPAIFQRHMDTVLSDLIGNSCYVYIDDILIFGKDEAAHDLAFRKVLTRLIESGMHGNKKKIEYKVTRVKFLGHIIEPDTIKPAIDKIEAITKMKEPTNTQEVQQFMGIINYYRKFIRNCADKSEALLKLMRKETPFCWGVTEATAFMDLKRELLAPHILFQPDFEKEFILETDASNHQIGAVLTQKFDGIEHPVVYLSRRLKNAEINYSISEKEMLAALWAMEHLHYYLYGRKFILRTDHKALEALNTSGEVKSPRIERWQGRIQNYTFKVEYRRGRDCGNADTLSRQPIISAIGYEPNGCSEDERKQLIIEIHNKWLHRGAKLTH